MNQAVTVTGMILSAAPVGDYDKRVVILTKERGKISAFARGARRPNSSLVGVTTPFAFGEMTLYEGKSSYNLVQADISNYFSELRMDMEGAYYGFYFMEFADYYTKENNDEREMLKLLYQSLRALVRKTIPYELIRYIFELKSISINGEAPEVFACVACGSTEELEVFSESGQGVLPRGQGWEKTASIHSLCDAVYYQQQYREALYLYGKCSGAERTETADEAVYPASY